MLGFPCTINTSGKGHPVKRNVSASCDLCTSDRLKKKIKIKNAGHTKKAGQYLRMELEVNLMTSSLPT